MRPYSISALIGARVVQWVRALTPTSPSPVRRGFAPGFVNYKNGCTRLAAASNKVYQLLAHGRWFSPDIPASSTTKTGRHDIAEILLKVALKHQKSKSNQSALIFRPFSELFHCSQRLLIQLFGFPIFWQLIKFTSEGHRAQ